MKKTGEQCLLCRFVSSVACMFLQHFFWQETTISIIYDLVFISIRRTCCITFDFYILKTAGHTPDNQGL